MFKYSYLFPLLLLRDLKISWILKVYNYIIKSLTYRNRFASNNTEDEGREKTAGRKATSDGNLNP